MNKCILLIPIFILIACGDKKEKEETADNTSFLPVSSILRGQVKNVDTSLYSIIKIVTKNNVPETTYIKREEFAKYAADFLSLPDITQEKWKGDYDEVNFFDATLQSYIHSYTAKEEDLEIRKQDILTDQTPEGELQIRTIMAETFKEQKGESIRKNLLWHMDKRFQVITTRHKKNGEEVVEKIQVIWNRM